MVTEATIGEKTPKMPVHFIQLLAQEQREEYSVLPAYFDDCVASELGVNKRDIQKILKNWLDETSGIYLISVTDIIAEVHS